MADHILDARGLKCPLPVLKARKALQQVAPGGTLEVLATDKGAVGDVEAFCKAGGHKLVDSSVENGVYRFLIARKERA